MTSRPGGVTEAGSKCMSEYHHKQWQPAAPPPDGPVPLASAVRHPMANRWSKFPVGAESHRTARHDVSTTCCTRRPYFSHIAERSSRNTYVEQASTRPRTDPRFTTDMDWHRGHAQAARNIQSDGLPPCSRSYGARLHFRPYASDLGGRPCKLWLTMRATRA